MRPKPADDGLRPVTLRLVRDAQHARWVVQEGIRRAKTSVWIATANLKDLHVPAPVGTRARARNRGVSLFDEMGERKEQYGVDVRILHAGLPSRVLAVHLRNNPRFSGMLRRCLRVHLKMVAVDGEMLYLGSANFTGAGLGEKGAGRRNFEAGILTDDEWLLDELQGTFDAIWSGKSCAGCRLRQECPSPLDSRREPGKKG